MQNNLRSVERSELERKNVVFVMKTISGLR